MAVSRGPRRGAAWLWVLLALAALLILNGIRFTRQKRLHAAEGGTRGKLGALRSAVDDYRKANAGALPPSLKPFGAPKLWLGNEGARVAVPHEPTEEHIEAQALAGTDSGQWAVVVSTSDKDFGFVFIDCTHTDSKGSRWASY